jgi:CRISPR/Cas system-associated protein Cas10 (large subunit of type III CRISPR-Cas system)
MNKEYIEREAVIENIKRVYCTGCNSYNEVMCRACGIADALLQIDAEPAADVAPVVHGEWVLVDHDEYGKQYECSVCGRSIVTRGNVTPSYCRCGAKMDGGGHGN